MANNGLYAVAKRRAEFFFKKWNHSHRAKELEGAEEDLRSHMDSTVERAIRGKRIALFAEMLEFHDFPDKGVVDELLIGASLTGEVVETGTLPFEFTPALLTQEALKVQSELRRDGLLLEPKGSGDLEVDTEVWKQTLEARDRGWLFGPIPLGEVPVDAPISEKIWTQTFKNIKFV